MKENFPLEYLYVDVNGDTYYKRYSEKKEKCNVNPYTLASTPVIFAPHSTVQTIFELVKKNEQIKPILFYADEFLKEAEKEPEAKDVKGKLRFYWYGVEFDKDYFEVAPVKMEVDGIDENGEISEESQDLVMTQLRGSFRPEFLNRLDEIIMFKPLTKENIGGIIKLQMDDINRRIKDKELHVSLSEEAKDYIVDMAYDPSYGARPLKRFLQKNVETLLAKEILADHVDMGDELEIVLEAGALQVKKK